MGSVDIVLPSRDSARIARTFILTLQRYKLFLKLPNFYVAFQIIGEYLLFLNYFISNSYTILREYDDFRGSRSCQPITLMTGTE